MNVDQLLEATKKAKHERAANLEKKAHKILLRENLTLVDLADRLDCAPREANQIILNLRNKGYNLSLRNGEASVASEIPCSPPLVISSKRFFDGKWHKFGLLGDTHLCSKWARLDVLRALYDIYEREGVTTVLHAGNIVDGECRFNRHELVVKSGFEPQAEYLAAEYPQRKGIETWFITGEDHEGWWVQREGINVGERLQQTAQKAGRNDLRWIGHTERDIYFKAKNGSAWARIMHPGGGTAYAISYTTQKLVESFQGGEKPHMLFVGHYHKYEHGYPREVHVVQSGCVQDQSSFMRRRKIQAHVGGAIVRFHQSDSGEISRFVCEWIPFYDRKFYAGTDKFSTW